MHFYNVMSIFQSKRSGFLWKGSSQHLLYPVEGGGATSFKKSTAHTNFLSEDPDTCNKGESRRGTLFKFFLCLFSLVNPLDVGLVNLNLRGFCSDAMDVLIKGLMFTA